MEEQILFSEEQKFKQWWLWLLFLGLNGMFVYGIYQQVILKKPFGDNPTSDNGLFIGFGFMLMINVLFWLLKLQTEIKSDGIYVRFYPFQIRYRNYSWSQLNKLYIRKYSAIKEYGGWGIRLGLFGSGKALNVSGNKGLQLVTIDNSAMLIGTNKPEELKEVLAKLGQYKP